MNYSKIFENDVMNGSGIRTTLFVSGCIHECKGCYNQQTWDPAFGQPFTRETLDYILETLRPDYISGLSLSGGDPLYPGNLDDLLWLVSTVKQHYPDKDVWLWTGFRIEKLSITQKILASSVDYIIDGRYVEKRPTQKPFRGSDNQRLINTKDIIWETLKVTKYV